MRRNGSLEKGTIRRRLKRGLLWTKKEWEVDREENEK